MAINLQVVGLILFAVGMATVLTSITARMSQGVFWSLLLISATMSVGSVGLLGHQPLIERASDYPKQWVATEFKSRSGSTPTVLVHVVDLGMVCLYIVQGQQWGSGGGGDTATIWGTDKASIGGKCQ